MSRAEFYAEARSKFIKNPNEICLHVETGDWLEISKIGEKDYPIISLTFVGVKTKEQLLELLKKGLNCWDTAPKEFKELDDILRYGKRLEKDV